MKVQYLININKHTNVVLTAIFPIKPGFARPLDFCNKGFTVPYLGSCMPLSRFNARAEVLSDVRAS